MWGINSHGFSSLDPIPVSDLGKVHRDERKMQKCSKKGVETDKVRKKQTKCQQKVSNYSSTKALSILMYIQHSYKKHKVQMRVSR